MAPMYSAIRSLFLQERYSDLTLKCRHREFKVHRAIVCSQSPYLADKCDSHESKGTKELGSLVLDLSDEDPENLERLLSFLYSGNYEDGEYPTHDRESRIADLPDDEISLLPCLVGADPSENEPDSRYIYESDEDSEACFMEVDSDDLETNDEEVRTLKAETSMPLEELKRDAGGSEPMRLRPDSHSLYISLRLYSMSEKFGVPGLKTLSRERFYRTAERLLVGYSNRPAGNGLLGTSIAELVYDDFIDVVDELYETVPVEDSAMRQMPCMLIATLYYSDKEFQSRMRPLMLKRPDLAVGVLHSVMEYTRANFGTVENTYCVRCDGDPAEDGSSEEYSSSGEDDTEAEDELDENEAGNTQNSKEAE